MIELEVACFAVCCDNAVSRWTAHVWSFVLLSQIVARCSRSFVDPNASLRPPNGAPMPSWSLISFNIIAAACSMLRYFHLSICCDLAGGEPQHANGSGRSTTASRALAGGAVSPRLSLFDNWPPDSCETAAVSRLMAVDSILW